MKYEDILIPTLIQNGVLTRDTLQEFIVQHGLQPGSGSILDKLVEHHQVTETAVARASAELCRLEFIDLSREQLSLKTMALMQSEIARHLRCIPFRQVRNVVRVAISELPSDALIEGIKEFCGDDVQLFITTVTCIDKALRKHYPEQTAAKKAKKSGDRTLWLRPAMAR